MKESPISVPASRRSPKGIARRRAIIDAAVKLFAEGGYDAASLSNIANEVGISQAGLLHHFPSKSALLVAAVTDRDERLVSAGAFGKGGAETIQHLFSILRQNELTPALVKLNAIMMTESLLDDHPAQAWAAEVYDVRSRGLGEAMHQLIDEKRLPVGISVDDITNVFIAANEGIRFQWLMEGQNFHRSDRLKSFLELLRPYFADPDFELDPHAPN